ncbi:MAG: prepilin-type N-terminal cleavage/methylation domain-containing protein [bacterium]|nr:prepilin-type N-terminal cleavage/methylation domain-containing protein [bacterium]
MRTDGLNFNERRLRQKASASQGGQSLLELMVAIGISALLIGGAATVIALALRVDAVNKPLQGALFAAQGLIDNIAVLGEADWRGNIGALSPAPATYYVDSLGGDLAILSGAETLVIDAVQYTRYFTIEDVTRDTTGAIATPGTLDPSTKKITATAEWQEGVSTPKFSLVKYVARSARNTSSAQVDWSGGSGQVGTFAASDKYDVAGAGIDTVSQPGTIKLQLP